MIEMVIIVENKFQEWNKKDVTHLKKYGWTEYGYENSFCTHQQFINQLNLIENKLVNGTYKEEIDKNRKYFDIINEKELIGRLITIQNKVNSFEISFVIYDEYSGKGYLKQAIKSFIARFSIYEALEINVIVRDSNSKKDRIGGMLEGLGFSKRDIELYTYQNPITDLELLMLNRISYANIVDEHIKKSPLEVGDLKNEVNILCLENIYESLKKKDSFFLELINNNGDSSISNYTKIMENWSLVISLQGMLRSEKGRKVLNEYNVQNVYLDAFLFHRKFSDQYVIVFKGSNFSFTKQGFWDFNENLKAGGQEFFQTKYFANFKRIFTQTENAVGFYKIMQNYYGNNANFTLTGHSKGGVLVQKTVQHEFDTNETKLKGVTFSSPPSIPDEFSRDKDWGGFFEVNYNCINYFVKGDKLVKGSKILSSTLEGRIINGYVGNAVLIESEIKDFLKHSLYHYVPFINSNNGMLIKK